MKQTCQSACAVVRPAERMIVSNPAELRPPRRAARDSASQVVLGLAILWSREEPDRVGEVALPPGDADLLAFGRAPEIGGRPLGLVRQRAGDNQSCGPLRAAAVSRVQLLVRPGPSSLGLSNVGRLPMLHDGREVSDMTARAGDIIQIGDELVVMVVYRLRQLPALALPGPLVPAFGCADAFGIVGESAAAWELRRQLAFAARQRNHVLLSGPSGGGHEVIARALHHLSHDASGPWVAHSGAWPDREIDAELFGTARDAASPGAAERPGLVGRADGGTLFLDDIDGLPAAERARLLRMLDDGTYQRAGDPCARAAQLRLVASCHRAPHELDRELAARLPLRIAVPGLDERREDVPLVARHVLRELAARDPDLARFFHGGDPGGEPRWTAALVTELASRSFTTHVRELAGLLWDAMRRSPDGVLDTPALRDDGGEKAIDTTVDPRTLDAAHVQAALHQCGGVQERAWRALGLRSRYQLIRLLRKYGLSASACASVEASGA